MERLRILVEKGTVADLVKDATNISSALIQGGGSSRKVEDLLARVPNADLKQVENLFTIIGHHLGTQGSYVDPSFLDATPSIKKAYQQGLEKGKKENLEGLY